MNRPPCEKTLKLTLGYDGTRFAGWQRQKNRRTVQASLEQALQQILNERTHVVGAGRTDSGVHAQGQVAHVAIHSSLPAKIIHRALNAVLPEDIVVYSVRSVSDKFHARFKAKSKRYRYTIWNQPYRPLFGRNQLLHIPQSLNVKAMRKAARLFEGAHDFRAFHSTGRPIKSSFRTLYSLKVRSKNGVVEIAAEADGFLYHMVRRITGLLIEIGKGKMPPTVIPTFFRGRSAIIPPTAPAKGLCLMKVHYP